MSEEEKSRKVEWSFSFEDLGNRFRDMFGSFAGDEEVKTTTFSAPLENATGAVVKLGGALGRITVHALENADHLIDAEMVHVGDMIHEVSGDAVKTVIIRQKTNYSDIAKPMKEAFRAFSNRDDLRWDIGLSPRIPLEIEVDSGVGLTTLDLTGMMLKRLEVDGGVGGITVTLPAQQEAYNVDVESGVGQTRITIPDGAQLRLSVDGGVGATDITIPANAAVRVKSDGSLGGLHLPANFERVQKGDDFISKSGVWQTAGFDLAERKIMIDFDGGVGRLSIHTHEMV